MKSLFWTTMDDRISQLYGVDNQLCLPQRSASYWAVVCMFVVVILESARHAPESVLEASAIAVVASFALLFFTLFRVKLSRLAEQTSDAAQLRALSSLTLRITGGLQMVCLLGESLCRHR